MQSTQWGVLPPAQRGLALVALTTLVLYQREKGDVVETTRRHRGEIDKVALSFHLRCTVCCSGMYVRMYSYDIHIEHVRCRMPSLVMPHAGAGEGAKRNYYCSMKQQQRQPVSNRASLELSSCRAQRGFVIPSVSVILRFDNSAGQWRRLG